MDEHGLIKKITDIVDGNISCLEGKYCSVAHEIRKLIRKYDTAIKK
jgi:hypothetical protein